MEIRLGPTTTSISEEKQGRTNHYAVQTKDLIKQMTQDLGIRAQTANDAGKGGLIHDARMLYRSEKFEILGLEIPSVEFVAKDLETVKLPRTIMILKRGRGVNPKAWIFTSKLPMLTPNVPLQTFPWKAAAEDGRLSDEIATVLANTERPTRNNLLDVLRNHVLEDFDVETKDTGQTMNTVWSKVMEGEVRG